MVFRNSGIPVFGGIGQSTPPNPMTFSVSFTDPCLKSRQINQLPRNKRMSNSSSSSNHQNFPTCTEPRSSAIDVVILIVVIGAFGFLLYPYVKFTYIEVTEFGSFIFCILQDEIYENPVIYGCLGLSMICVSLAAWGIMVCTSRKCGNQNCRGLWKAAEFDIQLETEECVKSSNSGIKDGVRKGLFELPRDHHRELESELKKIAPTNGKAVLVFRARCGCFVGRIEVPGPRKTRKTKK